MRKFSEIVTVLALFLCTLSATVPAAHAASVREPNTITIAWLPNNSGDSEKALREMFGK